MINGIVFSKDRAAQLKLFLDSVEKNANGVFSLNVLYTYSNDEFEKGYNKLMEQFPEVKWIKEIDFREQTLAILENSIYNYTSFFTDDDIIYGRVDENEMISKLETDNDAFCFSMRLGLNTNKCYTMRCDNVIMPDYEDDKFIKWNWSVHYMDFGYPLSVDGHIFKTKEIHKLSKKVMFQNPNTFEAALQMFGNYPKKTMWSYKQSKLVNSPSNVVQSVFPNREGEFHGISAQELNDNFLSGREIKLNKIDFSNIVGCHQELELPFE
jgi:hypothetical protein